MRTFDLTAALGDRANQPEISRLLVAQLMTSNNEDTRKLRRAQEREQTQELNELAHRLAGMASLIHAHAVERACHQLEIACGESSVRKLTDAVDDLVTALGELQCELHDWMTMTAPQGTAKVIALRAFVQDRQVQRANGSHPDGSVAMVEQIVAGDRVDEHHQVLPMDGQPGHQLAEHLGSERQLAAPVRMRPYRPLMDPPHLQRKAPRRLFAKGAGSLDALRIEIDVSMEALDAGGGILVHRHLFKRRRPATRPVASRRNRRPAAGAACAPAIPHSTRIATGSSRQWAGKAAPVRAGRRPGGASRWPRPGRRWPPGSARCSCRS
ncbi:histidine phosphotransfer domain-containing protein [Pseudomonas aeruginosa LESlike1]|nr:histidine phosphotransfer domain-containing protein [Pseudomonas aeruginosa LESlike1]